ncbi:MAG: hypothetical protein M3N29_04360, partial [Chloroflexota bacterium]|nr:hypothetical protein [Chloroflexota bacterium]
MTSTRLPSGTRLAEVADPAALATGLAGIGLRPAQPVIVLIGGAAGVEEAMLDRLYPAVRDGVLATAAAAGAAVIDGGTDSGVMALAGRARVELA